mmetsp:Transcript_64423/g.197055  ORF Transcript_64423/g.197055 Transcript_64423/m.197055 type:complete len:227 (-) Transcript_64423:7-687(-)
MVTMPPAASIRAFSPSAFGLWSMVSKRHGQTDSTPHSGCRDCTFVLLASSLEGELTTTARESPQFRSLREYVPSCCFRITAPMTVEPDCSSGTSMHLSRKPWSTSVNICEKSASAGSCPGLASCNNLWERCFNLGAQNLEASSPPCPSRTQNTPSPPSQQNACASSWFVRQPCISPTAQRKPPLPPRCTRVSSTGEESITPILMDGCCQQRAGQARPGHALPPSGA